MSPADSKGNEGTGAQWRNPLRDKEDKRLPRIAGRWAMVLFGVTGDLAHKKVVPAVYDLANRGLLPPTFALVGFGRRDWDHDAFAQVILDDVKEHCRTPFRQAIWERLAGGLRVGGGGVGGGGGGGGGGGAGRWRSSTPIAASAATTPSTWRSPPSRSRWCASSCTSPGWPARKRTDGAASSSRNHSATT